MIDFYSSFSNPNQVTESTILMTNSEAGVRGEAMIVTAGRLTKCTALLSPFCILTKTTVAGTDVVTEYQRVRKDMKWKADVTGVGTPVGGTFVNTLATDGLAINAAVLTGGKVEVIAYDATNSKAIIMFV